MLFLIYKKPPVASHCLQHLLKNLSPSIQASNHQTAQDSNSNHLGNWVKTQIKYLFLRSGLDICIFNENPSHSEAGSCGSHSAHHVLEVQAHNCHTYLPRHQELSWPCCILYNAPLTQLSPSAAVPDSQLLAEVNRWGVGPCKGWNKQGVYP